MEKVKFQFKFPYMNIEQMLHLYRIIFLEDSAFLVHFFNFNKSNREKILWYLMNRNF